MRRADKVLAVLGAAAVALIAVELMLGALSVGEPQLDDPCTAQPAFEGGGLDGAVQRFALSTLNGAACELGTTREELVLSFVPDTGVEPVRWDRETIDRALRAGFDRAAEDVAGDGVAGRLLRLALDRIVAPTLAWFLGLDGPDDPAP
jgi:hypothetical protein